MIDFNTGLHYPIALKNLPETWYAGYIEQFTLHVESGFACGEHNSDGYGVTHLRPMNISRIGQIDLSDYRSVPESFNEKRLHENDVLFNNTNSPELIGKTAYVAKKHSGLAFSNHMTRLAFHPLVFPKYAALQLHYLWMMKYYLHRCVKHVNQASISTQDMVRTIPFVLPPLNEQKRIVAKIEELFSELDNSVITLKTAREQLKIYRQVVLKHAFEGKLTTKWREENFDKLEAPEQLLIRIQHERDTLYHQQLKEWEEVVKKWEANGKNGKKPSKPTLPKKSECDIESASEYLEALPFGWCWLRLNDLLKNSPQNGVYKPVTNYGSGCQIIRIDNFYDGSVVDVKNLKRLRLSEDEIKTYGLNIGELIINRVNSIEYLGKSALIRKLDEPTVFESNIMRCSLVDASISKEFITLFLNSKLGRQELCRNAKHAVNQASINQTDVGNAFVPVCSIAEQKYIEREVGSRIDSIEQVTFEIELQLLKAETLRQSILKKAFSGTLVPQDPNEEPASELLERIKAEKEQQKAPAKKSAPKPNRRKVREEV